MNTPTNWQTTVTTHDLSRAAIWTAIFGENRAPVKSIIPTMLSTRHASGPEPCYLLDLGALTIQQFERLSESLEKKFGFSHDATLENLRDFGVPIPASECVITSTDSGMMHNLLDFPLIDEGYEDGEDECWYEN